MQSKIKIPTIWTNRPDVGYDSAKKLFTVFASDIRNVAEKKVGSSVGLVLTSHKTGQDVFFKHVGNVCDDGDCQRFDFEAVIGGDVVRLWVYND